MSIYLVYNVQLFVNKQWLTLKS